MGFALILIAILAALWGASSFLGSIVANWLGLVFGCLVAFEGYRTVAHPSQTAERQKLGTISVQNLRQFGVILIIFGAWLALANLADLIKG